MKEILTTINLRLPQFLFIYLFMRHSCNSCMLIAIRSWFTFVMLLLPTQKKSELTNKQVVHAQTIYKNKKVYEINPLLIIIYHHNIMCTIIIVWISTVTVHWKTKEGKCKLVVLLKLVRDQQGSRSNNWTGWTVSRALPA